MALQQDSIVYLLQFTLQCKLKTHYLVRREALFGLFVFSMSDGKMERVGQKKIYFMKCIFLTLHFKIVNPKFEKETATGQLSLP